jgi:hypothetical protein
VQNRERKSYEADSSSVDVMFYFKDAPIPPSKVVPAQLAAVQTFRQRLGDRGLYWTFNDLEELQLFLRIHLTRKVLALRERGMPASTDSNPAVAAVAATAPAPPSPATVLEVVSQEEAEEAAELGLLDLVEIGEEAYEEVTSVVTRMKVDIDGFSADLDQRTTELNEANASTDRNKIQQVKRVIKRAADNLHQYVDRTQSELPAFSRALQTAIRAQGQALAIATDFGPEAATQLRTSLATVSALRTSMAGSTEGAAGLRDVIRGWPRMTGDLIRAKKRVAATLDSLIRELEVADALLAEVETPIQEWLERNG